MRPGQKEYLVWQEGDERESARVFVAFDHEDAAKDWAENYDSGDYTIIEGSEERVYVALNEPDSVAELYLVYGEVLPEYYARLIEEEK